MFVFVVKASPGTPAYKSQEEYYDQILEYKKVTQSLNSSFNTLILPCKEHKLSLCCMIFGRDI